jgi:hypothetical protein
MYAKFDLNAATPAELADRLGVLEARKASIQAEIDATKGFILAADVTKAAGKRYEFTVTAATCRESFKPSRAKAMLSAAQIAECTECVYVKPSVRIKARKA